MEKHECSQMEFIGKAKEFMEGIKGLKVTMFLMAVTIATQIITFAFLWGGLTTTVKVHDQAIEKLVSKFDKLKVVGYAIANDNGASIK